MVIRAAATRCSAVALRCHHTPRFGAPGGCGGEAEAAGGGTGAGTAVGGGSSGAGPAGGDGGTGAGLADRGGCGVLSLRHWKTGFPVGGVAAAAGWPLPG